MTIPAVPIPILSFIVFTPLVGALLILLIPRHQKEAARVFAAAVSGFTLLLALWAFVAYDRSVGGYQFVERISWLPQLGIHYYVGVDGVSLPLVLLSALVLFTGVLVSWNIEDRPHELFAFMLLLASGIMGVFVARNLVLLFFFYEIAIFPKYFLIAIWGSTRKEYAAMKLVLYTLVGSIIALVGALALYFVSPIRTFDMDVLRELAARGAFARTVEVFGQTARFDYLWFLPVFLGFAVTAGLWPFHNWVPDGHSAAPTAGSMFLAGVVMKVGAYSALRVGIELMPGGAIYWLPVVVFLAVVAALYSAAISLVQEDLKYVIAFSSIGHMAFVTIGFAAMNTTGLTGAVLQMFSHGVMAAILFAVVGMVYDQAHTRYLAYLGGFARAMPMATLGFILGGLVAMGMPGFSGFVAEFQVFAGIWAARDTAWWYPWVAILAAPSIALSAAYILRALQATFFGELDRSRYPHVRDVTVLDKVAIVTLAVWFVLIGVFPRVMTDLIQTGVEPIAALLQGAMVASIR